ncbi:head maturation protease, ClpP-related [uncultured Varibaculum sp.]|uniref:head maturation protease, ClpP-related n=1 Tax=uncultured Varibaculum sp. TaxID=413896 RepID=UPI00204B4311|nr:head maturation protease, ClpP-related [uncultured Varibaculum sp.]DAL31621.1 MAG TPA_asm: Putative ATP dependent Clp protease [Caudoviricetes sp.]
MKRFWNWLTPQASDPNSDGGERVLRINGVIAEESWLDDDITPAVFASELNAGSGPVTIWLNSPGGDVVAAARIYNMLLDYPGKVTVNIDGIAASAASVIAMAASTVAMSPVSMLMIHNPATLAMGDKTELSRALDMLESVKDSIINAYQLKTGLSRAKLSKLMDAETWMDATAAIELGFADELLTGKRAPTPDKEDEESEEPGEDEPDEDDSGGDDEQGPARKKPPLPPKNKGGVVFSRKVTEQRLVAQLAMHGKSAAPPGPPPPVSEHPCLKPAAPCGRRVVDLYAQLTDQPH